MSIGMVVHSTVIILFTLTELPIVYYWSRSLFLELSQAQRYISSSGIDLGWNLFEVSHLYGVAYCILHIVVEEFEHGLQFPPLERWFWWCSQYLLVRCIRLTRSCLGYSFWSRSSFIGYSSHLWVTMSDGSPYTYVVSVGGAFVLYGVAIRMIICSLVEELSQWLQ